MRLVKVEKAYYVEASAWSLRFCFQGEDPTKASYFGIIPRKQLYPVNDIKMDILSRDFREFMYEALNKHLTKGE